MKEEFGRNQKGFTLIELIVVLAVIAILSSATFSSLGLIASGRAKKFVTECDSLLSHCKINALAGASQPYVKIYEDAGTYYGVLYEGNGMGGLREAKREELGNNLTITVGTTSGSSFVLSADKPYVCLGFDRTTGAFLDLERLSENSTEGISGQIQSISVTCGVLSRSVKMVASTGYFYVE